MTYRKVRLSKSWGALTPVQCEMERAVRESDRVILLCGRQVGKTEYLARLVLRGLLRGEQAWWVAPTHTLGKIGFERCIHLIRRINSKRWVIKRSPPFEILYRPSGGRCVWLTSGNRDSLQGATLDLVVYDEAATDDDLMVTIDQYIEPTLAVRRGRLVLASTPRGYNDFAVLAESGLWRVVKAPTSSNPLISPDWLESQRRRYEAEGNLYLFRQEYEAEILKEIGRFFETLPRVEPLELPGEFDYCGIDWGYSSPYAAVFVQVRESGVYVVRTDYERNLTPEQQASRILSYPRARVYLADSSTPEHVLRAWQQAGLYVKLGTKDRVGSLQLLRQLIGQDKIVVDPSCVPLLREMERAEYNIRRPEDMIGDDHAIDALRYVLAYAETKLRAMMRKQELELERRRLDGADPVLSRIMRQAMYDYQREYMTRRRRRR